MRNKEEATGTKPKFSAQPGRIGTLEIKNRLVMPAMCTNYTFQGRLTGDGVHYYGLRAKGGVGLIIVEAASIDFPIGRMVLNCAISGDEYIPGMKKLVEEIHRNGAKVALQILHAGRQTFPALCGSQPVSSSGIGSAAPLYADPPRGMTLYECRRTISQFGEAALRAKKAGFDAVELHFAHGYLASSFLSPVLNHRTDEYGGIKGGITFCSEVVEEVKRRCGPQFPVICRLNGDDYSPEGGVTHIDARMISVALEKAGADCINVSAGLRESNHTLHDQSMASPRGAWMYLAEGIRKAVGIPVMVVKRIAEDMIEDALAEGKADFVCIGRPHLTDPEYAKKVLDGRSEDVLPCIWCCQGCYDRLWMLAPVTCLVNPAVGRKDEAPIDGLEKAAVPKKVVVIGGGPAGMEAALVCAKRGHEVTLFEREGTLGGSYRLASSSPAKREVGRLVRYFERALPNSGVRVVLGSEATPGTVEREHPDAVIVAAGADPAPSEKIPGPNGPDVVSAEDVMSGRAKTGKRVVIWTCSEYCNFTCRVDVAPVPGDPTGIHSRRSYACRAGYAAVDTAEYLASRGRLVSIVTERDAVVPGMGYTSRSYLLRRFYRANIRVCSAVKVREIRDGGILLEKGGVAFPLDADTLIVSVGARPRKGLSEALREKARELYVVGDGNRVGNAMKSMEEGYAAAMRI
ncbi:MAG: FAD-dependent oxidoreductase [bacterium]|nr:FAD-dependent oxidoreductase [bacterium]